MNNEPDESFEAIVDDFFPEPEQEATPAQTEQAQDEPVQAQTEPEEATEEPEEPKETLSPLLAEKAREERELRAQIAAVKGSTEQQVQQARDTLLAELKTNPQKFINDYGIDNAGDLAAHFYAADLGDDAPPELKQLTQKSDFERYQANVEARFAEMKLEQERAARQAEIDATAVQYSGFISAVPEALPYFAAEAKHSQEEAFNAMAEVADHMYSQNGTYPSAAEVAQLIETQISQTAARYSAINQPSVEDTPKTVEVAKKLSQTLSTSQTDTSKASDPQGEDALFEDALKMLEDMM